MDVQHQWTNEKDLIGLNSYAKLSPMPREIRYFSDAAKRLGRLFPMAWWMKLLMYITPAKHRNAMDRFAGYVLLEPK